MKYEEAGELVLRGDAFEACDDCAGEGRFLIETRTEFEKGKPALEVETYQLCTRCDSTGLRVRKEFREACHMTGRPSPSPPARTPKRPASDKNMAAYLRQIKKKS
jgi:hypothetical protein